MAVVMLWNAKHPSQKPLETGDNGTVAGPAGMMARANMRTSVNVESTEKLITVGQCVSISVWGILSVDAVSR